MPLPPMPPMSGPMPTPSGQRGLPTPQDARSQGSDLALRLQALLRQCDSLAEQVSQLAVIAPFAQDDLLVTLSGLQGAREKILLTVGQEIEQTQTGNSMETEANEVEEPNESSAEMASY